MSDNRSTLIRTCLEDLVRVANLSLAKLGESFEATLGVSLVELDTLSGLQNAPDRKLTMGAIGQRLTISTTSVTRVVDGLEARGCVSRLLSKSDRRVVYAVLADEGASLLERASPIAGPILEDSFGRFFTSAELESMRALLRRVLDNPRDSPSAATADEDVAPTVGGLTRARRPVRQPGA